MSAPLAERLAIQLQAHRERERKDPLDSWRPMSWVQEKRLRELHMGEFYDRAANVTGKTNGGASLAVALARGRTSLGGIALPPITTPNDGLLFVPSYKQSTPSSIAAVRQMIGDWPCVEGKLGGANDYVSVFHVKPERSRSDDWRDWSHIHVFPHAGELPEGVRLDWAWADEPPSKAWAEIVRFRRKAGRPFYRWITATPKKVTEWRWLKDEFEARHGGRYNEWANGFIECVSTVYDNKALDAGTLREIERDAEQLGPLAAAVLRGEYVDTTGSAIFLPEWTARWRARIREPQVERVSIEREVDTPEGAKIAKVVVDVQRWFPVEEHETYLVVIDTGKGVRDGKHDPDCLHVYARRKQRLVARINDYVGGHGIGYAGGWIAKLYNNALVKPLVTGGYGQSVLSGLRAAGYSNIEHHWAEDRPGEPRLHLGTTETNNTVGEWVGAAEAVLRNDTVLVESEDVIATLEDLIRDEKGRVVAATGWKDDWSCFGAACWTLGRWDVGPYRPRPEPVRPTYVDRVRQIRGSSRSPYLRPELL